MNELKVKIPFWYKPFIKGMPRFYEELPEEKEGNWSIRVKLVGIYSTFFGSKTKEYKYTTNSIQKAYLKVRWKAYWTDVWDLSDREILWAIKNLDK